MLRLLSAFLFSLALFTTACSDSKNKEEDPAPAPTLQGRWLLRSQTYAMYDSIGTLAYPIELHNIQDKDTLTTRYLAVKGNTLQFFYKTGWPIYGRSPFQFTQQDSLLVATPTIEFYTRITVVELTATSLKIRYRRKEMFSPYIYNPKGVTYSISTERYARIQ
ncbi:hypothetical protein KYK14_08265 [Hymenobacter profundi]|uniref:Lipocalin-like domain-containing protein n=1 Tax=Hymenobacter profundi TaxID=1982110 RepID=A0ABS6WYN4_9BACT|nr:hypothetical protein [Hymenobacter profundi]